MTSDINYNCLTTYTFSIDTRDCDSNDDFINWTEEMIEDGMADAHLILDAALGRLCAHDNITATMKEGSAEVVDRHLATIDDLQSQIDRHGEADSVLVDVIRWLDANDHNNTDIRRKVDRVLNP